MLAWFKRNATPASRERLVENESQTLSEEKVQRLVGRHGNSSRTANELTRGFTQTYVIVVACQKGGSGKTTIAAHLAVQAGRVGQGPAILVDTDPQGSLGEWRSARKDDAPALATAKLADLAANPAELWSGKAVPLRFERRGTPRQHHRGSGCGALGAWAGGARHSPPAHRLRRLDDRWP